MHVGLVVHRLIGRSGGERGSAELAAELAGRGLRITLLVAGQADDAPAGCEVVELGVGRLSRSEAFVELTAAADRERRARGIDLLHSMSPAVACDLYQPRGGTVAETFARYLAMPRGRLGRLAAWWKVNRARSSRGKLAGERAFYGRDALPPFVAMSHYVARQLGRHYAVPPERVNVVFGAVQAPQFQAEQKSAWRRQVREELGLADDGLLFLFVAQRFHQKGLGYLVEALRRAERSGRLGRRPSAVVIVGRDEAAPYQRQAARCGLAAALHFRGRVEREAVWPLYAAADAVVLPTVYDACSRVVLEGLAVGTPAITTEHNGAGELVDQHGAGCVVHSAWAIAELADAIGQAADPAVRARWAAAAEGLGPFVRVQRQADELIAIYDRLMAERKEGGGA